MMLGEKVSAADADRLGMVFKVFPDDSFADESLKIASTLSQMPTKGLAFTKHALNHSFNSSMEAQLLTEDELQRKAAETYDYNEGVAAFLEKRIPVFKGE